MKKDPLVESTMQEGQSSSVKTEEDLSKKEEYSLFYPDNTVSRYHTGKYKISINGVEREYLIVDGVIRVFSLEEKALLVQKGFLFLNKQEVTE